MLDAAACMRITDANSKCIMQITITRFVDTKMTSVSYFQDGKMEQEAKTSHSRKQTQC